MRKLFLLAAVATTAFVMSACGGGNSDEQLTTSRVATADLDQPITASNGPTIVSAVSGLDFEFPQGVPDFGTTDLTDVTMARVFTAGSTPSTTCVQTSPPNCTFAITVKNAGQTASGSLDFGSCIFNVTSSNFPAGSRLANGARIVVDPCNLRAQVTGEPADGVARPRTVQLLLRIVLSNPVDVQIAVNASGQVLINGVNVGTVPITPLTGA